MIINTSAHDIESFSYHQCGNHLIPITSCLTCQDTYIYDTAISILLPLLRILNHSFIEDQKKYKKPSY
jgi:hypothetical protein